MTGKGGVPTFANLVANGWDAPIPAVRGACDRTGRFDPTRYTLLERYRTVKTAAERTFALDFCTR
jgi:hypothetical protein